MLVIFTITHNLRSNVRLVILFDVEAVVIVPINLEFFTRTRGTKILRPGEWDLQPPASSLQLNK